MKWCKKINTAYTYLKDCNASILLFINKPTLNCDSLGSCGVSFFLILSGFVMSLGYEKKVVSGNFNTLEYLQRRTIRVYPLHILCLITWLLLHFSYIDCIEHAAIIGTNLLLIQSWIPIKDVYFSCNAVSWCLSDLLFFYAIFPLIVKILSSRYKWIFSMALFIVYFIILFFLKEEQLHAFIYISPIFRLTDFVIGILLFKFVNYFKPIIQQYTVSTLMKTIIELSAVLVVIASIIFYYDVNIRFSLASWYWLPSAVMIVVFSLFERGGAISKLLTTKPLVKLGDASFTFYLIHTLAFTILGGLFKLFGIETSIGIRLAIYMIIISLSALIITNYIEKPISHKLSRILSK